jgi:hypothetical protein
MATDFLCGAGAALLGRSPRLSSSILSEVKPSTGEPDAGEPPVRFGGRGDRDHSILPTPIFLFVFNEKQQMLRYAQHDRYPFSAAC